MASIARSVVARPLSKFFPSSPFTTSLLVRKTVTSGSRITSRKFSSTAFRADQFAPANPPKRSFLRRFLFLSFTAVFFTSAGFIMAAIPAFNAAHQFLNPPTDAETLTLFEPQDDHSREVEDFIQNHPEAKRLRQNPDMSESRPHLKIPESQRGHNLTGGTLLGPGRVVVPPFTWNEKGGKSLVQISYLSTDLCGHPGVVHGGFLATMLDEGMARCCFAALPNKIGLTASLTMNYRRPTPASTYVVLRATTTKVEGRKAWVVGRIETLAAEGEEPVVLVEAEALFIEPRQAAALSRIYASSA